MISNSRKKNPQKHPNLEQNLTFHNSHPVNKNVKKHTHTHSLAWIFLFHAWKKTREFSSLPNGGALNGDDFPSNPNPKQITLSKSKLPKALLGGSSQVVSG